MKKEKEYFEIDLYKLFSAMWHKAWLILLCAILVGGSVFAVSAFCIQPKYKAEAVLYVNNKSLSVGSPDLSISQGDLSAAQSLVETYGVILKSRNTINDVMLKSGVHYSYKELTEMISSEAINGTEVFKVEVTSHDAAEAELLANTIARVLPEKIAAIVDGSSVRIVDRAVIPTKKSSPNVTLNTVLGAAAGVLLAAVIVIVKELNDDEIHDTDYLIEKYEAPILAVVPDLKDKESGDGYYSGNGYASAGKRKQRGRLPSRTDYDAQLLGSNLNFAAAETYKLLRTNLEFSTADRKKCRVIGITSAVRGEGKTTTAINTAYSFAEAGKKVLLVEGDMRLPNIARRLKLQQSPGLSNLLSGSHDGKGTLQSSNLIERLWVISGGDVPPNPAELIGSSNMRELMKGLAESFDVIIVDLPPVGIVSDALSASNFLDGFAIVVRQNICTRKGLTDVVRKLEFVNAKILGFVVTGSDIQKKSYKYQRSKYGDDYYSHGRAAGSVTK